MKTGSLALVLLALCSSVAAQSADQYSALVTANNRFAIKYLRQVHTAHPADNTLLAPMALSLGFGLLQNGADEPTKLEIGNVFEREAMPLDRLNQAAQSLLLELPIPAKDKANQRSTTYYISNSLWSRSRFRPAFGQLASADFLADTHALSGTEVVDQPVMNSLLAKRMPPGFRLTAPALDPDEFALMTATSFEGRWMAEFDPTETHDDFFKLSDGTKTKLRMMRQSRTFPYYETDQFQGIFLGYTGEQGMYVLLPRESFGIEAMIRALTFENWKEWSGKITGSHRGTLVLPKFNLESCRLANEDLAEVGLKEAFAPGGGHFPTMFDTDLPVFLTRVIEKVLVDVNEKRTIAQSLTVIGGVIAGVSGGGEPPPPPPFYMIVDHPFVFVIKDMRTGSILYIGAVMNPNKNSISTNRACR